MPIQREELGELWRSINHGMHEAFRQAFSGYDRSPVTLILMRHTQKEPGITVNELARRARLVKSHVSKLVDDLVHQGYIEKRPDPDDQRLVRLYLTQAAANVQLEMEARARTVLDGIVREIPEDEIEETVRGLRTLQKALLKSNEKVNT